MLYQLSYQESWEFSAHDALMFCCSAMVWVQPIGWQHLLTYNTPCLHDFQPHSAPCWQLLCLLVIVFCDHNTNTLQIAEESAAMSLSIKNNFCVPLFYDHNTMPSFAIWNGLGSLQIYKWWLEWPDLEVAHEESWSEYIQRLLAFGANGEQHRCEIIMYILHVVDTSCLNELMCEFVFVTQRLHENSERRHL